MREMFRSKKGYLSCYASGDGALHFCWQDEEGQANSIPVTRGDCTAYLKTKWAKHLRERGWRVAQVNTHWCLVAPIERIDADHVTLEGRSYRYTLDDPKMIEEDSIHVIGTLHVWFAPGCHFPKRLLNENGEAEVKHWGTCHAIAHYLAYEDQLTEEGALA